MMPMLTSLSKQNPNLQWIALDLFIRKLFPIKYECNYTLSCYKWWFSCWTSHQSACYPRLFVTRIHSAYDHDIPFCVIGIFRVRGLRTKSTFFYTTGAHHTGLVSCKLFKGKNVIRNKRFFILKNSTSTKL